MILSILTILVFVGWQVYWSITEKKADIDKPKTIHLTRIRRLRKFPQIFILTPLVLQIFGVKIFVMPFSFEVQIIGFILVLLGVGISVLGRVALGTNWTHAEEYQIKKHHRLVTSGIYKYIRHPIYTGLLLAGTGAALVAQSYLFIAIFIIWSVWGYNSGKREEKILEKHFGTKYVEYKKRTKMLIPFVW